MPRYLYSILKPRLDCTAKMLPFCPHPIQQFFHFFVKCSLTEVLLQVVQQTPVASAQRAAILALSGYHLSFAKAASSDFIHLQHLWLSPEYLFPKLDFRKLVFWKCEKFGKTDITHKFAVSVPIVTVGASSVSVSASVGAWSVKSAGSILGSLKVAFCC